jgi:vacuolar protein sorting-associated protein 45
VLESIAKGKLKDSVHPPLLPTTGSGGLGQAAGGASSGGPAPGPPSEVVVFLVGGATFEEATKVAEFNVANPSMRVILGGSCVHNSHSFLQEITSVFGKSF